MEYYPAVRYLRDQGYMGVQLFDLCLIFGQIVGSGRTFHTAEDLLEFLQVPKNSKQTKSVCLAHVEWVQFCEKERREGRDPYYWGRR